MKPSSVEPGGQWPRGSSLFTLDPEVENIHPGLVHVANCPALPIRFQAGILVVAWGRLALNIGAGALGAGAGAGAGASNPPGFSSAAE